MGFDNEGNVILRNREYRRRKIQLEIDPKNLPKKKERKKKSKKNYLAKYQHIAVHEKDYLAFLEKVEESGLKKVETFHDMVKQYKPKKTD